VVILVKMRVFGCPGVNYKYKTYGNSVLCRGYRKMYKSIGGDDITLQCYSSEQITEMEIHRFTDEELNTSEVTDNGLN